MEHRFRAIGFVIYTHFKPFIGNRLSRRRFSDDIQMDKKNKFSVVFSVSSLYSFFGSDGSLLSVCHSFVWHLFWAFLLISYLNWDSIDTKTEWDSDVYNLIVNDSENVRIASPRLKSLTAEDWRVWTEKSICLLWRNGIQSTDTGNGNKNDWEIRI